MALNVQLVELPPVSTGLAVLAAGTPAPATGVACADSHMLPDIGQCRKRQQCSSRWERSGVGTVALPHPE